MHFKSRNLDFYGNFNTRAQKIVLKLANYQQKCDIGAFYNKTETTDHKILRKESVMCASDAQKFF